jgi:RNA polymerase sigma factor (TIGR02999 family)
MTEDQGASVGSLINRIGNGDRDAAGLLVQILYPELKRIAVARMSQERTDHTWQPTALVELVKSHELRLTASGGRDEKDAFMGFASHVMARLLLRHARRLYRRVSKTSIDCGEDALPLEQEGPEGLHHVNELLSKLEALNPRLRAIVELRVFEGLSGDEIASRLGCSRRTVLRDWNFAKQLISSELSP